MKKILTIILLSAIFVFGNDLATIQKTKTIRIGVRLAQPPFSQLNDSKEFVGFEVELAKKIGEDIVGKDGKVELIGVNAGDRIPFLNENKADLMIANFSKTPEREKQVLFSMPYLTNNTAVVSKKSSGIKRVADLYNVKVLVIPNTTTDEWIQKKGGFNIVYCSNTKDCFDKLQSGEGDAYIHTNILLAYLPLIDSSLELSIKVVGELEFIGAAVAKGNDDLMQAVNNQILELSKNGFFKQAYNDTLNPFYKGTIDKKYLLLDDLYNFFN
ncbi:transporter substrate-binding domain-containing protein [Campylobacter geochelonis]|uniref:Antigenic protein n=1 Tax=Campylobacter geochelonis TaxID=1780362 RepID=A0A128EBD2_9BACT|nr:transporter substrate-binding domain-containing protein [Campylobacter geochelonis]QKF70686.1 amino acid ABC transporter, periplasmic cysteine-binding protein [Campylobacter geochelonis]CZE45787.1 antigenic protein [Campylobacter geochelonis]CZE46856.1 antigenic protein [Campylobacter geochelonis]CZE50269.1 antigenic protein [Campylobacter geochelonis]